jgi:hypothetical protein
MERLIDWIEPDTKQGQRPFADHNRAVGSLPTQMLDASRNAPFLTFKDENSYQEFQNGHSGNATGLLDYFGQTDGGELVYRNSAKPFLGLVFGAHVSQSTINNSIPCLHELVADSTRHNICPFPPLICITASNRFLVGSR